MTTHTAAILPSVGASLELKTLPIPEAVHGSAIVKVLATPISAGAKHILGGAFPIPLRTPVTPSSSCIGRIHTAGPDATVLTPGQLVLVDFWNRARDDPDTNILQGYLGGQPILESVWENGTFAEYARVPLENCFALNEDLLVTKMGYSFADLAYINTLCIALAGLLDINVKPGDTVIVAPATGFFGGSAVHAALALGTRVIACGRNSSTLAELAETFKTSSRLTTVQLQSDIEKDTAAIKAACSKSKGADAYIDYSPPQALGNTSHIVSAISALRPHANVAFMGGVFGTVEIPYFPLIKNNIRIQGRYMYDRWHGEQALRLLETGLLKLGKGDMSGVKVQSFELKDINKAMDMAEEYNGWGNMVVLEPL